MKLRKAIAIALSAMLLPSVAGAVGVGDPAPDFSTESTQGPFRVADFQSRKNLVLAFYFADFTPV